MRVGVPRESTQDERRVALVPETAGKLSAAGFEIGVESGAGAAASFPDEASQLPILVIGEIQEGSRCSPFFALKQHRYE